MMTYPAGRVRDVWIFPVKSMSGCTLPRASIGSHGLAGDRRYAFILAERSDKVLTARQFPELLLFKPHLLHPDNPDQSPVIITTPSGEEWPIDSPELLAEIGRRCGCRIALQEFRHGVQECAAVSLISWATVEALARAAGVTADERRYRSNIVIVGLEDRPFAEDNWVGRELQLENDGPLFLITDRTERCMVSGLDPNSAKPTPGLLKQIAQLRQSFAGIYASVIRPGSVAPKASVSLRGS